MADSATLKARMDAKYNEAQRHSNDTDLTRYRELMKDWESLKADYIDAYNAERGR